MGRAMLIICSGVLVAMGFVSYSASNTSRMLNQRTVDYADYTMSKNAAHTAIQMAMQQINQNDDWPNIHNSNNPWVVTIQDIDVALYTDYVQADEFWEADSLWLYSNAQFHSEIVQVRSLYLKQRFSSLVPEFTGGLGVAADPDKFTFSRSGNARIIGDAPEGSGCEDKPAINTIPGAEGNFSSAEGSNRIIGTPQIGTDPNFNYQPTDELIARLANSPDVQYISGNYTGSLGSKESPGVFFVESEARLTGGVDEGFGIMVVRTSGQLEMEGEDGGSLDLAGNFTFNGLIIFENAYNFNARGTPTINGSILVGHTDDYDGTMIDIDISGNMEIQYDCRAEDYAKMAAASAIEQNKYTRVVTTENIRYPVASGQQQEEDDQTILDLILGLF